MRPQLETSFHLIPEGKPYSLTTSQRKSRLEASSSVHILPTAGPGFAELLGWGVQGAGAPWPRTILQRRKQLDVVVGAEGGWARWSRGLGRALTGSALPVLFPRSSFLNLVLTSWSPSRIMEQILGATALWTYWGAGVSVPPTWNLTSVILPPHPGRGRERSLLKLPHSEERAGVYCASGTQGLVPPFYEAEPRMVSELKTMLSAFPVGWVCAPHPLSLHRPHWRRGWRERAPSLS